MDIESGIGAGAEGAGSKKERVPGQEGRHDETGFRKDDQEKNGIGPYAILAGDLDQVNIDMHNEIDECLREVDHGSGTERCGIRVQKRQAAENCLPGKTEAVN